MQPGIEVVLLSGGLDSCVVAAQSKAAGRRVIGLYLSYGSKHEHAECVAGEKIARALGIERIKHHLPQIFGPSALLGTGTSNVVPARNTVFLAHGIALAAKMGGGDVLIGSSADDAADFVDCRSAYIVAASEMAELGTAGAVSVRAPLVDLPKADVIQLGLTLRAPLALTYSCYRGVRPPCGECQACRVRAAGFAKAGLPDPALSDR